MQHAAPVDTGAEYMLYISAMDGLTKRREKKKTKKVEKNDSTEQILTISRKYKVLKRLLRITWATS